MLKLLYLEPRQKAGVTRQSNNSSTLNAVVWPKGLSDLAVSIFAHAKVPAAKWLRLIQLLRCMSPVVALLRHHEARPSCPLPAVKRSCRKHRLRSESDHSR